MKRVLVTGGAGFIGSAVCRYLVKDKGVQVLNIDKLTYAGVPESLKRLKEAGAVLVIVTNQPVIARGMIDEPGLQALHKGLVEKLGSNIDAPRLPAKTES